MTNLFAARAQMGVSLAFHIIFAVLGIGMPLLMVLSELKWLRTGQEVYLVLTKRWAKGAAILFPVGAVSGTVLSFELGLLWPGFMKYAGAIIGMPFSLEGFAFFTEAIFLGLYLYGWDRLSKRMHLLIGMFVALSGMFSGIFVVCANAWMNSPVGFDMIQGKAVHIHPFAAMLNPAAFSQTLHMTVAAYLATGAIVVGLHAWKLLKDPQSEFHRAAMQVALPLVIVTALFQPFSGDLSARYVAHYQPEKFAAMEGQFETERGAPLRIGGVPDLAAQTTRHALEIPRLLSLMGFHDSNAEVKGLKEFPRDQWPNTLIVHLAFQLMVACGLLLFLVAACSLFHLARGRRRTIEFPRWLLRSFVVVAPLGFVAVEAGWVVTEMGRQPWIIYHIMRTREAVTPMPWLVAPFLVFTALYVFLAVVVGMLMRWQIQSEPHRK